MANFVTCRDNYAVTILYFMNLTQGEKFIGIFCNMFRGNSNETYTSLVSTLSYSIYDKTAAKSVDLSPK